MSGTQISFYPLNGKKKFPNDLSNPTDHSDQVLTKYVNDYAGYASPQFFVNVIIDICQCLVIPSLHIVVP